MIVVVVAMGMMGGAIGARLAGRGAQVRTSLAGRSGASIERARRAGIAVFDDDRALLDGADTLLSIVPPAVALDVAQRFAPHLARSARKPVYVDCNAVAPQTLASIAVLIEATGAPFVDAAIFGIPPKEHGPGPRIGLAGDAAPTVLGLRDLGLDVIDLAAPAGAASALKMCTGALTKGLTALGVAVTTVANERGIGDLFRAEMQRSQPELSAWLDRQLPGVETKAERWAGELDENAIFFATDEHGASVFEELAAFYRTLVPEGRIETVG
jgi:putative dehydrogenase